MACPLFRGVCNSKYHLESTLDRLLKKERSYPEYLNIIKIAHKHITTCTGKKWDLNTKIDMLGFKLQAPEFMVYLRHNGFPSPLLDWTRSPHIAAFFAFRNIYAKASHASIYVYRESTKGVKSWSDKEPRILTLGSTIETDYKHFLQQSEYSFCVKAKADRQFFANHENVPSREDQDVIFKYNIPASERQKVLKKLDEMNITSYSLFNSEASLMETLSLREIFFREWARQG